MRRLLIPLLATALFTLTPTVVTAQHTTATAPQPAPNSSAKNPGVGAMLSLFVPGGGQMYAGRPGKGVALLLMSVGGLAVAYNAARHEDILCDSCNNPRNETALLVGAVVGVGTWIYGMADAPKQVRRWNQEHGFRTARVQPTISLARRRTEMGLRIATH